MGALFARLHGRSGLGHVLALSFTLAMACLFASADPVWEATWATGPYLGVRIAVLAGIAVTSATATLMLVDNCIEAATKTWWDPAETPDGELRWEQLIELVHKHHDPLIDGRGLRTASGLIALSVLGVALACLAGAAEAVAGFAWNPSVPPALLGSGDDRTPLDALINLSGNLTAFLALLASAISIWFTFGQLRAKVRADNRQEWLGRTRNLIARVVALAAEHATVPERARSRIFRKLDPLRLELELMLNPREKDHRLLVHLVRRLTFIHDPSQADAADEGVLVDQVRGACDRLVRLHPARWGPDLYGTEWRPILETTDVARIVTVSMRLSHVLLKREWERVKGAR